MKKLIVILSICLAVLVLFCVGMEVFKTETPPETEPPTFTVRFETNGELLFQQNLTEGSTPTQFPVVVAGGQLTGWLNQQGESIDPFSLCISAETTYQAVIRPVLENHVPYLFTDEENRLLPDEDLTWEQVQLAVKALAVSGAEKFFPEQPTADGPVTGEELSKYLSGFFDIGDVTQAFAQNQTVTRTAFAKGMNLLLGRGGEETFLLLEEFVIPSDIHMDTPDATSLLEAALPHTPEADGQTWESVELPTTYEPGFVNIDGWLYYVQENGYFLKEESVGTLYFGADGRYTSTDAELDETVAALLKDMIEKNPDADDMGLLRIVFDYCHKNYTYRRIYDGNPDYGATGWEIKLAKDMFASTKGNCYSFSAIFWALSRGLGYETRAISGKCLSDEQPHSWCMIELEGEDYIFDPQWQNNYTERGIDRWDMFKIPKEKFYIWLYKWVA